VAWLGYNPFFSRVANVVEFGEAPPPESATGSIWRLK